MRSFRLPTGSPSWPTAASSPRYGPIQVLRGVDLALAPGETLALMGRNGMGKTTLLRSLIGLVADRRGRILLDGKDVTRAAPESIARGGVALVPEGRGVFAS